jgi:fermentation-respiration switch protein FrsA (DUF1100 family)
MRAPFTFESGGDLLRGWLETPQATPVGAVVISGPVTSVKEQAPGAYAQALAARGFAALAFDHRYFGESGGVPRQLENPYAKAADIRAAVAALRADPGLRELPVHALGVCAGAGYTALAVSEAPDVTAFAAVAGYFPRAGDRDAAETQAALARGREAERRFQETGEETLIPAVGPDGGDVAMPLREAYEFYGMPRGARPNYRNAYAVQSYAYTPRFDAVGVAPKIAQPTFVVHSEHALAPPLARAFMAGLPDLKGELWLTSQGQIDFYDDPRLINEAADAVAGFFRSA